MNGVHDMGGMQCFGAVRPEADEPVFHERWEGRAMALTVACGALGQWTIDASRFSRERIEPATYLASSYYERWLAGLTTLLVERGLITADELERGEPDASAAATMEPAASAGDAVPPDRMRAILDSGGASERQVNAPPMFAVGETVRARTLNPEGHTRLPRYVRGKIGQVVLRHGAHVFPDTNAAFEGEHPQHLYAVRFAAAALFGPERPAHDSVTVDLWESYLEHA